MDFNVFTAAAGSETFTGTASYDLHPGGALIVNPGKGNFSVVAFGPVAWTRLEITRPRRPDAAGSPPMIFDSEPKKR